MKIKFASIILIFSFIFTALQAPMSSAAENSDEISRREELLSSLITLPSGVSAGSAAVTRGQYAHALALLLGAQLGSSDSLLESGFYDVTGYDAMTRAIIFLENKNIISGDTNKYFNPEDNIKAEDALKMLLTAMGYKPMADSMGGYPDGYIKVASDIGVTKNVPLSKGEDLTGEQLINIFYNSLDTQISSVSSIVGGDIELSSEEETLLSGILKMGHMQGMITETPYTGLYSADGCTDGTVTVGDVNFYYTDSSVIDYLGYNVDVYYSEENEEKTIKAFQISKRNEVLSIDADWIEGFSDYKLSYNPDGADRTKTITLDKSIAVVYNGKFTDMFTEEMVDIDMGTVTLISDGRSDYSVMIIEDYIDYIAASVDTENEIIYTRSNGGEGTEPVIFDLSESDVDYKITSANGTDLALTEIAGNSIMSVASSLDKKYIKIIVCDETISGNLSSTTSDENENPIWIINDVEYPLSRSFYQNAPSVGSGVKAFLNYRGKIAYFLLQSDSDGWQVGYIIKIYDDEMDGYCVKMLKSDNLVEDFMFANKVNINGDSYSEPVLDVCDALFSDNRAKRQVIRYRTNSDNEINRVQTALEEGSVKSQLRTTTKAQRLYRSSTQSFGFETFLTGNTYIFIVPEENTPYVPGVNTNFKIVDSSYFADNSQMTVQAYTVGDNMTEAYALVATRDENTVPTTISDYLTPYVVTDISRQINEYDEEITTMTVVQGATENTYEVTSAALEQPINAGTGADFEVEVGDAIRFTRSSEGKINLIEMIYDASEQRYTKPPASTINASYNCSYAFVYGRAEYRGSDNPNRVFVNVNFTTDPSISYSGNRIIPIEKFGATVVDMSGKRPEVMTGDASELVKTADIFGPEKSSRIIYNTNFGTPTRIIIYNY